MPLAQIFYRDFVLLGFLSVGPSFCCQLEQEDGERQHGSDKIDGREDAIEA